MGFDLHAKGIRFLDAPVSGMESRAIDGTLTIMCAGDESLFHEMQPLLSYVGNKILFMGEVGNGQLAKLINQLLFDINVAALAEILPIAAKMGLNPQDVGEIVNSGTGKSYASEYFIPRILKGEFSEGYPLSDAYKDLISSVELTFSKKIPVPILSAVSATYQAALLKGYGKEAKGAMIKVYEELSVIPGIFITTQRNYPIKRLNCRISRWKY
jgi:3-hydroxyisobutyrate dehydrogenase-like beta-hydroxyacid dehydrogenase